MPKTRTPMFDVMYGKWRFRADALALTHPRYEIDLERIDCAAAMLDSIVQVANKGWTTNDDVACVVQALNDLFLPQESMCSGGVSKPPLNPKARMLSVWASYGYRFEPEAVDPECEPIVRPCDVRRPRPIESGGRS